MKARDLDRFCGLPYCERTFDCADLVALVQRELYGKHIALPGRAARERAPVATAQRALSGEIACGITEAEAGDGDVVLMHSDTMHLGVLFVIAGERWVLHAFANVGYTALQRVSELRQLGVRIEGYYRCV